VKPSHTLTKSYHTPLQIRISNFSKSLTSLILLIFSNGFPSQTQSKPFNPPNQNHNHLYHSIVFFCNSNIVNSNHFLIETKPNRNLDEDEQSWKGKQPWKDEQPWKGEDEADIKEQP